jgi:hypothetical protein
MALGSTQPLTEMSTRGYLLGSKGGRYVDMTILLPSCTECLEIMRALLSWNPKGLSKPVIV